MSDYIQIVDDSEPFEWTPETPDGAPMKARLSLQVLSEEVLTALRKKHNRLTFRHGQRVDEFDAFAFAADVVDKAVVSWTGVLKAGTDLAVPCERAAKLKLPERLKVEIMRLCAGKEAGSLFSSPGDGSDPATS